MVNAVLTYGRQRFSPLLFGALATFLFLFAKGSFRFQQTDYMLFPILVALLFLFRLFDDLQNHLFDRNKPGRSYTKPAHFRHLNRFSGMFFLVMLALIFLVNQDAFLIMFCFCVLNVRLYKLLLNWWKFRNVLPLLKYPFLCLFLIFLFRQGQLPGLSELTISLSVFPAFVLYESLTDENFRLNKFVRGLLFLVTFLPFLFITEASLPAIILALFLTVVFIVVLLLEQLPIVPYLLLFSLLLTRLMLPL